MEKIINDFLNIYQLFKNNSGSGSGSGNGYGSGSGYGFGFGDGSGDDFGNGYGFGFGDGSGDGYGFGFGDGSGSGSGDGSGDGDGGTDIIIYNNQIVYNIDTVPTIIEHVRNNIAAGYILQNDFTLTKCFIVKENNYFSHGSTLKEAYKSLFKKLNNNYTIEEKIIKFKNEFKDFSKKYPAKSFFVWHNVLTNSCKLGRLSFVKDKNINLEKDFFTVYEFIELTKNLYNGENIMKLL